MVGQDGGHDRSTSVSPNNLYEKYAEYAKEYFKRIIGSKATVTIGFRVPVVVKSMYDVLPPEIKHGIRKTVVEMIRQAFDRTVVNDERNIIINVNMPVALAKAESKVDVKIDVSSLLAELDELKEMIYSWHRHGAIPKAAVKTATARIKNIEKMIKGVN